jgi:hypothetical protein
VHQNTLTFSHLRMVDELAGWQESTLGVKTYEGLPKAARKYLRRIEELCAVPVDIISTGPDRDETIVADLEVGHVVGRGGDDAGHLVDGIVGVRSAPSRNHVSSHVSSSNVIAAACTAISTSQEPPPERVPSRRSTPPAHRGGRPCGHVGQTQNPPRTMVPRW